MKKIKADLTGVSETALLTLCSRANEARRPDAIINDPMAVLLADTIDYPFDRFGTTRQDISIRAKAFDAQALAYLAAHPRATVVALAEGFQTSFWRLNEAIADPEFSWLTVDLPPIVRLREQLLPTSPRIAQRAQSALDLSWADAIDPADGVFITAEGLLMYLQPEQSLGLIADCAARFPGGEMMFDLAPPWFTGLSRVGLLRPSLRYRVPDMPFSMSPADLAKLPKRINGIAAVRDIPMPAGRGWMFETALQALTKVPFFDEVRASFTVLEFG